MRGAARDAVGEREPTAVRQPGHQARVRGRHHPAHVGRVHARERASADDDPPSVVAGQVDPDQAVESVRDVEGVGVVRTPSARRTRRPSRSMFAWSRHSAISRRPGSSSTSRASSSVHARVRVEDRVGRSSVEVGGAGGRTRPRSLGRGVRITARLTGAGIRSGSIRVRRLTPGPPPVGRAPSITSANRSATRSAPELEVRRQVAAARSTGRRRALPTASPARDADRERLISAIAARDGVRAGRPSGRRSTAAPRSTAGPRPPPSRSSRRGSGSSRASILAGLTYLPYEVFSSSFLRPSITRLPSSVRAQVTGREPSVAERLRRRPASA